MPASPKSPKKSGAPKGKGAVRAKSGCYTCRIRRKKCDEKPNIEGHCETCVRLRLECLGFGTKRPEWLRDNRNVLAVRDRIKTHLAAQGMIKGHSGAGPRNAEREPPVLRLHDDYPNSSSSASPPTPTLSISSSDGDRRPGLSISSMRDDSHYPLQTSLDPYHSGLTPRIQELSPNSPVQPSRGPIYANDIMLPPYNMSPNSLDSPGWQGQTSYPATEFPSRALTSSFSPTYTQNYDVDEYANGLPSNSLVSINNLFQFETIPSRVTNVSAMPSIPFHNMDLVHHYIQTVAEIQYLLADNRAVINIMLETMQNSECVLEAVCLLSSLHRRALNRGTPNVEIEPLQQNSRALTSLVGKAHLTEGDAMAGLTVVSWVLFRGGTGQWQDFLNVACRYSDSVLWHPEFRGPEDALMRCSESTRFIIKTSLWFDVLAAATRVEVPFFLEVYRTLFDPSTAYIDSASSSIPDELSMLSVMGCENSIVWALAEISNLACWKELQKRNGALSMPELVRRGEKIERHLTHPVRGLHDPDVARTLTSEVFRASARVYLHSVLSGDYPSCNEIADGVRDTIRCLEQVPKDRNRKVVRSVVFSICICGCLTDDPWQREFFLRRLQEQQQETVGNCIQVEKLIRQVWKERENGNYESVTWRDVMRKSQMLLV